MSASTSSITKNSSESSQNTKLILNTDKTSKSKTKGVNSLLAGSLSGLISCILFQPLDLMKTRLQQDNKILTSKSSNHFIPGNRLVDLVKDIMKKEGILGLWKGTTPTIIRNVPGMSFYFFTYTQLAQYLTQQRNSPLSTSENLALGAFSRTFVGFILMPITVIKVRVESDLFPNVNSINQAFHNIKQQLGWRGFFAGFGSTALRDAPYAGLYLAFYQGCKPSIANWLGVELKNSQIDSRVNLISGFTSGLIANLLTHPFDVIKTRVQLRTSANANFLSSLNSLLIRNNQGFILWGSVMRSFYNGFALRALRKASSSALSWVVFEAVLSGLK